MRCPSRRRPALLALAAALLIPAAPAPALFAQDTGEAVPAARRLPPRTYGFVSIPDVAVLKERFGKTSTAGLYEDPAMGEVREKLGDAYALADEKVREQLNVGLDDLLALPQGEVTAAVVQTAPREVAVVALVDYGDNSDTVDTLIEQMEDGLEENGATRSEEPFEGTDIVIWTSPAADFEDDFGDDFDEPNEDADVDDPRRFGYFLKDTHFVVASDPAALEAVLLRWDGSGSDSFADTDDFRTVTGATTTDGRTPALVWYASIYDSVKSAVAGAGGGNPQASFALAFLPVLGVDQLKAVGGGMDLATEEYESVGKVFLITGAGDKALGLFRAPPAAVAPPAWAGTDAVSYTVVNWDAAAAYDAAREIYDGFSGPGEFDLLIKEQASQGPRVNLKTDVVDRVTGTVEVVAYPIENLEEALENVGTPGAAPQQPTVVALKLKDADGVSDLIERLSDGVGGQVETRDFQGKTIYEIAAGENAAGAAVSGNSLLISTSIPKLEQALRGAADEPLAETPAYRAIAAKVPAAVSVFGFGDSGATFEAAYEAARSGQIEIPEDAGEAGDFARDLIEALPPFEAVAPYLTLSGNYVVPQDGGVLWVSFGVPAPEDD